MIREVNLPSYLPPFMAEYKEINVALAAENPEFIFVWRAADMALKNEFIATADEYGILRFEEILGIRPSKQDTIEVRRSRIQARWFTRLPYTWRMLIQKLKNLCGDKDFKIYIPDGEWYGIKVQVFIEPQIEGLLYEVREMLENFLPVNLFFDVTGKVVRKKETRIIIGSTRSVYVRIKAAPQLLNSHTNKFVLLKAGIGTVEHIKSTYCPERK